MTNIVNTLENKVLKAIKLQSNPNAIHSPEVYYWKAIAYCDCIQYFTNDKDRFDCFDRLREQAKTRKPAFS
jgi:tRNA A37 N6-isopentenylltransferase MiaA